MADSEKLRVDKYLWSIRLFKTRSQAADACDKGRVKIVLNNSAMGPQTVKASRNVNLNEVYEIKTEARKWVIKVTGLLTKRVGYPDAIKNYEDITPKEDLDIVKYAPTSFHTGKRLSKIGHPSKKDRRDLETFMDGRPEEDE
ncbi:RNA-binding S4 domain-containing protein [Rhizosphaericola mali]|uniref:RNA-binding S4 domain-containing protein n=1 Tax=Rhizosphaericola mali TaxID=2545455 RepID=A0A5P2G477_9BACT|nr:S4 domain-containing protein [Rhizosphaericola mali]QES89498.1 RNA-binding S4 domain-containing protein [Rhizosphaericola mali]